MLELSRSNGRESPAKEEPPGLETSYGLEALEATIVLRRRGRRRGGGGDEEDEALEEGLVAGEGERAWTAAGGRGAVLLFLGAAEQLPESGVVEMGGAHHEPPPGGAAHAHHRHMARGNVRRRLRGVAPPLHQHLPELAAFAHLARSLTAIEEEGKGTEGFYLYDRKNKAHLQ